MLPSHCDREVYSRRRCPSTPPVRAPEEPVRVGAAEGVVVGEGEAEADTEREGDSVVDAEREGDSEVDADVDGDSEAEEEAIADRACFDLLAACALQLSVFFSQLAGE